jgi:hypothetical protein
VITVLRESSWRTLDQLYDFALNDLGVDKVKIAPLQPTFDLPGGPDEYFAAEQISDIPLMRGTLEACDIKYNLGLSQQWLNEIQMYFESIRTSGLASRGWSGAGTSEHICQTYNRNITVDLYGVARLCFDESFPGFKLEQPGDLKKFWNEFAVPVRDNMAACNRLCGIPHGARHEIVRLRVPA